MRQFFHRRYVTQIGKLAVLHVITSLERGGAQTVLARLIGALASRCHHTVVCLKGEDAYSEVLRLRGVDVVCLDMRSAGAFLWGFWALVKLIDRIRPDVVQTWMYHADLLGGLAARAAGIRPVFWGIRNSDLDPKRTKWATRAVVRICSMLSSWVPKVIVSCSQRARDIHIAYGYKEDKFTIIPNGYDLSAFYPRSSARESLRASWGIAENSRVVGMVARWDPKKDHGTFLTAAAKVSNRKPDTRFVLVGPGITSDNLRLNSLIEAEGLSGNVILLGARADIPEVMSALDVHVLSSHGEAFPNVVAESMACGTPCIVTDVGDAAYIVGNDEWVVPPADSERLAAAILKVLDEISAEPATLKRSCRERIKARFSISDMAARYFSVWQ